ncbi:TraR/DksA C4-type zinc finger protein [Pasteurella multocida]|uniref:hypothetical protein n=1 Tax=Pasteurella multocida TaxID=747 RepID=UPI001F36F862|nr:hypothetical protein [Pasteurella multocida]
MNDIVDRTQEREELMWENWRKRHGVTPEQFANAMNTARCCVDCGVLIHPLRVKAMPTVCVA